MPVTHRPPPLALLRSFEAAARHLSFKLAAAELHVTPAAVSQQIRALEEHLGVRLFERLTRALQLSSAGQTMLPLVQQGLGQLTEAVRLVQARDTAAPPLLQLSTPPSFATQWLIPRLADFYARHPGIELHLSTRSAVADQAGEAAARLALERPRGLAPALCLAVLYGRGPYSGLDVVSLMTPDYVPVCAPGLATPTHPLDQPADLDRHVLIHDDTLAALSTDGSGWGWPQWLQAAAVQRRSRAGERHFSNAALALEAALAGQGVVLAARALVSAHLGAGSLVQPFESLHLALPSPCSYALVGWPAEADDPAVTALREWLVEQAGGPADRPAD